MRSDDYDDILSRNNLFTVHKKAIYSSQKPLFLHRWHKKQKRQRRSDMIRICGKCSERSFKERASNTISFPWSITFLFNKYRLFVRLDFYARNTVCSSQEPHFDFGIKKFSCKNYQEIRCPIDECCNIKPQLQCTWSFQSLFSKQFICLLN